MEEDILAKPYNMVKWCPIFEDWSKVPSACLCQRDHTDHISWAKHINVWPQFDFCGYINSYKCCKL